LSCGGKSPEEKKKQALTSVFPTEADSKAMEESVFAPDLRSCCWWDSCCLPSCLSTFSSSGNGAHVGPGQGAHYVPEPQSLNFCTFISMLEFPTQVSANTRWDTGCYGQEKGNVVPSEFHS